MIKAISVAAVLAGLFIGSSAIAAEQTTGVISSINAATGTLTLQSGETFSFSNPAGLYGFLPGDRVGVAHRGSQGINAYDPHPADRDNIDIN
jgi:hypothetical protein